MTDPVVRAYVIGQTPRPDLTNDLQERFPSVSFEVIGALDGLSSHAIETCVECTYPLETRLQDGHRVVVDASYVAERMQRSFDASPDGVFAHLVLCAGPFPELGLSPYPMPPVIRPFETALETLRRRGLHDLEIIVPFTDQAPPALEKWTAAGFRCRSHVLTERPASEPLAPWLAERAGNDGADAVVFDYVGFSSDALREIAARITIPVFDLGHLALDALQELLDVRSHR